MTYILTRQDNNDAYEFALIQRFRDTKNQNNTPLPIAGNNPEDSLIFTLQAQTRQIRIDWRIHDDNTDRSNGTAPSNSDFDNDGLVETPAEQKLWWENYMYPGDLGVQYIITGPKLESGGVKCVISNLEIQESNDRPFTLDASVTLTVGTA